MKFSYDQFSECAWFAKSCAALGMGAGIAVGRWDSMLPTWGWWLICAFVFLVCIAMSVRAHYREEDSR